MVMLSEGISENIREMSNALEQIEKDRLNRITFKKNKNE